MTKMRIVGEYGMVSVNGEGRIEGGVIRSVLLNCGRNEAKACSVTEEVRTAESFGEDVGWIVLAANAVDFYLPHQYLVPDIVKFDPYMFAFGVPYLVLRKSDCSVIVAVESGRFHIWEIYAFK